MREKISFFFQKLKLTIFPDVSRNVKDEIIRNNVYRLKKISAAVTAVEIVILTLFCVHYHFVLHYWQSDQRPDMYFGKCIYHGAYDKSFAE